MSKAAQSHELTYDLIKRAVHGDQEAIEAYLLHYDAYINFLVSYDEVGPDGRIYRHRISENVYSQKPSWEIFLRGLSLCPEEVSRCQGNQSGRVPTPAVLS